MNLEKSPKSALILSAVTVLSFTITDAILNIGIPYWTTGDLNTVVANPASFAQPGNLIGLAFFVLFILGILTAIGAYWLLHFFGARYFDSGSAIRWGLFGFLFAVFLKIPEWVLPSNLGIVRILVQVCGLFAAFFLARWIVPHSPQTERITPP
jgi:hypothetical protein